MQSQARTLDAAGLIDRMNRSPGVLLGADAATFLTSDDARIFRIEGSITVLRGMASRSLESAKYCRRIGKRARATEHLNAAKHYRAEILVLAEQLDGVVAGRDRTAQPQAAE